MFDFIKTLNLFNNDKDTEMDVDFKLKNKNGDNKLEHVNIAKKQIINNFGEISDLETLENLKELDVSHETKVKLINLKDALVQGKNRYALSEYLKMRNDVKFQNLPNKFQFKVLIGILNSKVNLNYDDEEIQNSINDIRALGDNYEGIHRFYYLQAIIKYKKRDFNSALNFINKSLEISSDYFKSKALKIVLECLLNKAGIKEAETEVNSLIKKQEIKTEEKEALLGALGDVFYNAQDYKNARKYYIKSNKYKNTLSKDIAIGTCLYYESFLVDSYSEELVPLEKIDFMVMDKSKSKFEEVISKINVDNVELISKLMFPYYFGILILHGEHDKLIEIYNKYKKELKLTNESVIGFIVEAQIKNNQLDIELLEKLSSRLYFSYKSLHHEMNSEFTKAIEILEQGIAEYPEDKQLRFGLLNSLRNTSNDDKYLHYYKKFNPNENDDALLMNYIIYLDENNKNDEFRKKREILLNKTENPMVLSHLFEMFLSKNDVDFLYKIYHKIKRNKEKFAIKNFDKIQYQLMMYFLERELHTKYLNEYANISFKYLENREKVLIDLNYLIITGEFEKASKKYYELFRITEDYELLLRLVELLFKSNQYYEIEFYLELIQPMELKVPEMFYIYYARYYELIEEVDKGIEKLDEIKEFALKNKKSIFHKFYFGYCLRNNKFGKAFNYYSEYEKINPEVDWLHKIQVSEDGDINELISQIDKISGGGEQILKKWIKC